MQIQFYLLPFIGLPLVDRMAVYTCTDAGVNTKSPHRLSQAWCLPDNTPRLVG